MRLAIEKEGSDPLWAPDMERQLTTFARQFIAAHANLGERFVLTRTRCRTTVCELQFFDYTPNPQIGRERELWNIHHIADQSWAVQFDNHYTHAISSIQNGVFEYRLYFKRHFEDKPPL